MSNMDSVKSPRTRLGERLSRLERFVLYCAIYLFFPEKSPKTMVRVNVDT